MAVLLDSLSESVVSEVLRESLGICPPPPSAPRTCRDIPFFATRSPNPLHEYRLFLVPLVAFQRGQVCPIRFSIVSPLFSKLELLAKDRAVDSLVHVRTPAAFLRRFMVPCLEAFVVSILSVVHLCSYSEVYFQLSSPSLSV